MSDAVRPVCLLLPDLRGGGAERSLLRLGGELVRRGGAVDIVVGTARGSLGSEVPRGVDLFDLARPRLRSALPSMVRYLRGRRPTHVVATLEHAVVLADWAIRAARVDTVLVPRVANTLSRATADTGGLAHVANRLALRTYRRADLVVAVSQGVADDLVLAHGLSRDRVRVVPNPVVVPEVLAARERPASHPWFSDGGAPLVVGMGRLTRQKNFPLLVDAFAGVREAVPDARLVILGDGEDRATLAARCRDHGITRQVDMPGFVQDPFPLLARAHVFVLSSDYEGLPGALIQALACGANVVATDCPSGPREVLDGGRHGALVPVGDVDALRGAIVESLRAPRRNAGPEAWGRWTADAAADQYAQLLAETSPAAHERSEEAVTT